MFDLLNVVTYYGYDFTLSFCFLSFLFCLLKVYLSIYG